MRHPYIFLLLLLFPLLAHSNEGVVRDTIAATNTADSVMSTDPFSLYRGYISRSSYDSAITVCDNMLSYDPHNAKALAAKANVYLIEHLWQMTIDTARRASELDPHLKNAQELIFWASMMISRPEVTMDAAVAIRAIDPADPYNNDKMAKARYRMWLQMFSDIIIGAMIIFFIAIAVVLFRKGKDIRDFTIPRRYISVRYLILIPAALTCILYLLFFHFSALIWSGNIHYSPQEYNPNVIRDFTFDHDGMEGYVMYILSFVAVALSLLLYMVVRAIRSVRVYYLLLIGTGFLTCLFLKMVGFYVPYPSCTESLLPVLILAFAFAVGSAGVSFLYLRHPRMMTAAVALILVPVCFTALGPLSVYDYSYIWSPALRLFHGVAIRDIYFQYDLYISLMALAFFKVGIDIFYFQFVAQAGYYIFFLGLFLFTRRFFYDRRLALLLLVFVVLFRFYSCIDPIDSFQTTPWRLDLWLVLVVLVYRRGAYHWSVGLFLGLLLIFHRNFGFIYLAAYLQLLLVLLMGELSAIRSLSGATVVIGRAFVRFVPVLALLILGFVASYIIFGGLMPESALLYQRIGIGMMRISAYSFYWYVPVLLGTIAILLIRHRALVSDSYFTTSIFILILTVGCSMYFFGRSHEHNIINLAGPLSLCLFLFIDQVGVGLRSQPVSATRLRLKKMTYLLLPPLFIATVCFFYSGGIKAKLTKQYTSLKEGKYYYPTRLDYDFDKLDNLTGHSSRVFFLDFDQDFLYYYYGHYKPQGYFNPNDAWVLKRDMAAMMQRLLDTGYYIVVTDEKAATEFLPLMHFDEREQDGRYIVLYRRDTVAAGP